MQLLAFVHGLPVASQGLTKKSDWISFFDYYSSFGTIFILVLDNTRYWDYYNSGGGAGEYTIQKRRIGNDRTAFCV